MSFLLGCVLSVYAAHVSGALECGTAPPKAQEKVSHGDLGAPGRWPWAAFVNIGGATCTGSVISDRFVLTAQHCVGAETDPASVTVVVGQVNVSGITDGLHVKKIHTLPGYGGPAVNDATILEIPSLEGVPPVCLPSTFEEISGEPAFTIGYGRHYDADGTQVWDGLLREDFINLQSTKDCSGLVENGTIQICVGGSRDPNLRGDSGGPLMTYARSENKWYQIGVDGYGCEDEDSCKPHGVTSFCKWIEESTEGEAKCNGPK